MLGCAVVRRAVVSIAAAFLCAGLALAQSPTPQPQADAMVEKFARDSDRTQAKKDERARKAADEAKAKKEADRKAAQAAKSLEVRREAEAQRAAAMARLKAEGRAREEKEMLDRAREEAENSEATAEIRRLIAEAEAATRGAEAMLAEAESQARKDAPQFRTESEREAGAPVEPVARVVKTEVVRVDEDAREATRRAAEVRNRLTKLARVRQVRAARLASQEQHRLAAERTKAAAQEEAQRLAQAAAQRQRLAEEVAAAERNRAAEAQRLALEAAQRQRLAEEAAAAERDRVAEMQRRAAQEEGQRLAQEAAQRKFLVEAAAAVERAKTAEAQQRAAQDEARRLAQAQAAERARAEEVRMALQARQKEAADRAAAEQKRRLAEVQPPAVTTVPSSPSPESSSPAPFPGRSGLGGEPDRRVAVLMLMKPGTYGMRRNARTADPVLCAIDGCYISVGSDRPAVFLPRRRALGVGNTLGPRAGACRNSLSCVFRDVELAYPAALQPVDLHIFKHDGRRPQTITADSDCSLVAGSLTCRRAVSDDDYVLWIVPERLATAAGPEVLERAVRGGLAASRSAQMSP